MGEQVCAEITPRHTPEGHHEGASDGAQHRHGRGQLQQPDPVSPTLRQKIDGPVIDRYAAQRIQWYIDHRKMREERAIAALKRGLKSLPKITGKFILIKIGA